MGADALISKLRKVQGRGPSWRAVCPAHESKHGSLSLSIREESDGRVLVHCFAGCEVEAIVGAVGLDLQDLMPPRPLVNPHPMEGEPATVPKVRQPWSGREVVEALANQTQIGWVILLDVANNKPLTAKHRAAARAAAEHFAELVRELKR